MAHVEVTIVLNGESRTVAGSSVFALLESLEIPAHQKGTAVAVNERVVPRARWPETELCDGDVVEIIRAAQGG